MGPLTTRPNQRKYFTYLKVLLLDLRRHLNCNVPSNRPTI